MTETILGWLREGRLKPGDRLPAERELVAEFAVGRNTLRESIQALVALGVLDVRPGRGTLVRAAPNESVLDAATISALLDGSTLFDLYELRRVLECEIAARAAERATVEDIGAMEQGLANYRYALEAGVPVYRADVAFHRSIAVASRNSVYAKVIDALADLLTSARRATDHVPNAKERALVQHAEILAAISSGDASAARKSMEGHIDSAIQALTHAREMAEGALVTGADAMRSEAILRGASVSSRDRFDG